MTNLQKENVSLSNAWIDAESIEEAENDLDSLLTIEILEGLRKNRFWYDDLDPDIRQDYREAVVRYQDARKILALASPVFFADYYLGWQLYPHQTGWAKHLETSRRSGVLGPTGHGKTIVAAQLLTLQDILRDPNYRTLIVSAGWDLARDNVTVIAKHLRYNSRILEDFGQLYSPQETWGKTEIVVKRPIIHKDATVKAVSIVAEFTGSKYHTIVFDDSITERNSRESGQRKKINDFIYGTTKHRLEAGGKIRVIGTRKNYLDWYAELIDSILWDVQVDKALIREPEKHEIVQLAEDDWILRDDGTYQKVVVQIQGDPGEVLCKDLFPVEELLLERYEKPVMFARERQNTIISSDDDLFKLDSLEACRDYNRSYVESIEAVGQNGYAFIVAGTDPAIVTDKKTAEAHNTSFMVTYVWGVYPNGHADLLFFYHERGNTPKQVIKVTKKHDLAFHPQAHYWESNSFGAMQIWTLKEETNVPIRDHKTTGNKHDYLSGVPSLSIMFDNKYLSLPYCTPSDREKTDLIIAEFMAVGKTSDVKSDVVMAMWITSEGAKRLMRKWDKLARIRQHLQDRQALFAETGQRPSVTRS